MNGGRPSAMRILAIGREGQLARALARLGVPAGNTLEFAGRPEIDLARPDTLAVLIADRRPDLVINAGAYTAVDKAESEEDQALLVNGAGPGALARACADAGAALVHVSTDYVFDGSKAEPYLETDPIAPLNAYGRSKAAGETAVLASGANAAVLRTAWVYSAHGANFVKTMLRLAADREEVGVVADQLGRPTWAADLAQAALTVGGILARADGRAGGIFHFSNSGEATWADFAEAVFEGSRARGGPSARVRRIATADFPTPAPRPANSRLDTAGFEQATGMAPRPWREALGLCLDELVGPKT